MYRWWNGLVDRVSQTVTLPLLLLLLFGAASVIALLWYFFPRWVPRRLPGMPRWRWRSWRWPRFTWPALRWPKWRWPRFTFTWPWRRRKKTVPAKEETVETLEPGSEEVPEVPVADFVSLADRLAAEGRFAEAVRERLRGMVRELIELRVLEHSPGLTVTELAAVAVARRPQVAAPLTEAGMIFSDIWYGERPAGAEHDARMKELAGTLSAALRTPVGAAAR
ncbi:hypothetical protein Val02_79360 [Virgisporangium aliadipatigenens]|uniref:Protein-glutamine gamma-glutamyltransferase-like C-terminal domain-containing protein n=1 Tax=Virgisporangium aliadipatigenens TaxID=741659 RepID=A0A8J3YWF7_9ACTN|nr:DUF4129 domain-containing protein [Virgisporangium aliadipatigenens]GIJ51050.1 hypothetical protein Val02_79360 [Virgisporangium aliadipatigenens]